MKGSRPKVVVVGSLVTDMVFRVGHRPQPGETLLGQAFGMHLGGKGFNQAVAANRLGARVTLVGRVGRDTFGDMFLSKLHDEGMETRFVTRSADEGTGVACPTIFPDGENSIIGVPRANMTLSREDVDAAESQIQRADVLMLQYEVNQAASKHAAEIARRHGTAVMLDPAPVHNECEDLDWPIDYLVPNEIEARALTECNSPEEWARELYDEELRGVVISRGAAGALVIDADGTRDIPGYDVTVTDSTGAGDAFRAGLAVQLALGAGIDDAVRYGHACGALACTVMGAEPSMPGSGAVESFIARHRTGAQP